MDMFHIDELLSRLKERVIKPLAGLKVVPYYGCLAVTSGGGGGAC